MAASSDSNDASDIFWPGYVDAVTNLAINLLFVIAVMAIVVISSILQIARMKPDNGAVEKEQAKSASKIKVESKLQEQDPAQIKNNPNPLQTNDISRSADIIIKEQAEKIAKLESENKQLKNNSDKNKLKQGRKDQPGGLDEDNLNADMVNATAVKSNSRLGENHISPLSAGGILVVFDNDVLELSEKEAEQLIQKITANYPLKSTNWQIRVNVPKGFSESARIGYYRVNAIRNILLKNNVPPNLISMRVVESSSESANNSRILLKAVQP